MFNVILEDVATILFICVIGAVFAGCVSVLGRIRQQGWKTYKFRLIDYMVLGAGITGVCCMLYGFFVEPFQLDTTFTNLSTNKMAAGSKPIRIVQLSDIHSDGIVRTEKLLPEKIKALKPDLILFTGDAANNQIGLRDFKECLSQLARIAPLYAVYGNHDSHIGAGWHIFEGTNAIVLPYHSQLINVHGTQMWIGGVAIDNEKFMEPILRTAPPAAFSVFLYHYPAGVMNAAPHNIDLVCVGHTHGGQICLPFYGAIQTESPLGKAFESGLHKVKNTWCYVNRGIGMTAIPARFFCKPEITVIDIAPKV